MEQWIFFVAFVMGIAFPVSLFAEDAQIIRPGAENETVSLRRSPDDRSIAETKLGNVRCDYVQGQGSDRPSKCCSKDFGCLDTERVHPIPLED